MATPFTTITKRDWSQTGAIPLPLDKTGADGGVGARAGEQRGSDLPTERMQGAGEGAIVGDRWLLWCSFCGECQRRCVRRLKCLCLGVETARFAANGDWEENFYVESFSTFQWYSRYLVEKKTPNRWQMNQHSPHGRLLLHPPCLPGDSRIAKFHTTTDGYSHRFPPSYQNRSPLDGPVSLFCHRISKLRECHFRFMAVWNVSGR